MTEIITSQDELLSQVMKDIIPTTKELLFLVGYFYFSGFEQIYESVKDQNMKILVGLDIDVHYKKIIEYEDLKSQSLSKENLKEQFEKYFVKLFNDTDFFDKKEKQESFKLFVEKLINGSLQLRKTSEPNHSKLYLFKKSKENNENGRNPGTIITGSSNLTAAGLKNQFEINVIIRDKDDFENMEKLFNQLWDTSVEISKEDFEQKIFKNIWFEKLPGPYLIYVRVLDELFSKKGDQKISIPSQITKDKFADLKYQIDAIDLAIKTIKKHSGVIIADVVGLGKSIIASTVAHNLRMKTIMIVPPHLKTQWEDYMYQFNFNGKVFSSGKMEDALREIKKDSEEKLIIVDEAHRYRNEETQDYAILHKICQSNKVILLTATPYSNKPEDIFSLIKLFQIPTRSTIRTVNNLSAKFAELIRKYKDISENHKNEELSNDKDIQQIGNEIRNLISPLIIRRSRIDLQEIKEYKEDMEKQNIKFPTVHDPEILEYPLGELRELYIQTLEKIAPKDDKKGFIGARYKPVDYLKNYENYKDKISKTFEIDETLFRQSQINLADFMRRHLVRRFESSMEAFRISLNNMIESSEKILKWYDAGYVPIYKKGDILSPEDLEEYETDEMSLFEELKNNKIENKLLDGLRKKGYEFIAANELKVGFKEDVQRDIKLLKEIQADWFDQKKMDPKLEHFKKILSERISESKGKVVIFSEFADTVNYLYKNLKDDFKIISYSASEKYKIEEVKNNFDAASDDPKDEFDILIATDAMSEGVSLNRANKIFNYDIPYNPTRVIQRVGRINRINKKTFDYIFIYNFFPSDVGEKEANVKHISTLKMAMIQVILGEDTKILTSDEELHSYFAKQYKEEEEKSWDVEYINFLNEIRNKDPKLLEQSREIPKRVRIKRNVDKGKKGVVVFGKKADEYVFKIGNANSIDTLTFEDALNLFKADRNEKSENTSDEFEPIYQMVKSKLFERNSHFNRGQIITRTVLTLKAIKKQLLDDRLKEYIDDLIKVIDEYDDLPKQYMKLIRKMNIKNYNSKIEEIKKEIPHEYLMSIINRAKEIDEGEEVIIFAEEF